MNSTLFFYILAIFISIGAWFYINAAYNPPQPKVVMYYNYSGQSGSGYINNTLAYPIIINYIYCTVPSGTRMQFRSPTNGSLQPGSRTNVSILTSNTQINLPRNCTGWKVSYMQGKRMNYTGNYVGNQTIIVQKRS